MPNKTLPPYENWWDNKVIEIVEDRTRTWARTKYKATDGYWIVQEGYRMLGKVTPGLLRKTYPPQGKSNLTI